MADAYKGLVIEIDGNTTKLSASLRSVQSDIRGTQSALKDVSKALKLDPGNVELTEQRFRLATKAVAAQEEKLAQLERASAEYGSRQGQLTDEEQAGYDKVQREIVRTKAALEGARKELEQAERQSTALGQALAKAGGRLTEFSDKYSAVADGAVSVGTKVATAAVPMPTAPSRRSRTAATSPSGAQAPWATRLTRYAAPSGPWPPRPRETSQRSARRLATSTRTSRCRATSSTASPRPSSSTPR